MIAAFSLKIQTSASRTRVTLMICLYMQTLDESVLMMEILIEELSYIALILNAAKTKILHTWMPDARHDMSSVDIAGDLIKILDVDACHKYLGKHLSLRVYGRVQLEAKHRIHQAWGTFYKHRKVILHHSIP